MVMSHQLRLYDYPASANCFKVRLLLAQLGLPYERLPVDIFNGIRSPAATLGSTRRALRRCSRQPTAALSRSPTRSSSSWPAALSTRSGSLTTSKPAGRAVPAVGSRMHDAFGVVERRYVVAWTARPIRGHHAALRYSYDGSEGENVTAQLAAPTAAASPVTWPGESTTLPSAGCCGSASPRVLVARSATNAEARMKRLPTMSAR
jgi:hypothetical protein